MRSTRKWPSIVGLSLILIYYDAYISVERNDFEHSGIIVFSELIRKKMIMKRGKNTVDKKIFKSTTTHAYDDFRNNSYIKSKNYNIVAYGHITLNTPVLVRSPKLSNVEPSQYLDG